MNITTTVTAAAAGLALAALPSVAVAHDGAHPFENCPAAYEAGYANIQEGDQHYGDHLDRDQDGTGCDRPPSDFVPAQDQEDTGTGTGEQQDTGTGTGQQGEDPALAETGGSGATPYLAAGGAAVLLAGGAAVVVARRRAAG